MSLSILGMGTAVPDNQVNQTEAAEIAVEICCQTDEQAAIVPALYRQSGIRQRHLAVPHSLALELAERSSRNGHDESGSNGGAQRGPGTDYRMGLYRQGAGPLALRAAREALERSGRSHHEITHLVTVSCTGFSAPGVDFELIDKLQLPSTVQRTNVGFMGCHGAINGLRVAQAYCDADPEACVLMCAVELCSIHYHFGWDPKRVVANALFADGAAALVGTSCSSDTPWSVAATGSRLFPKSEKAMTWQVGDFGFEMTLAARVPGLIEENLRTWLQSWLFQHGIELDQVHSWAIHPGGPRVLSAVESALGIDEHATSVSRQILSRCGNMSSPTVLFVIDQMRKSNSPLPCVAMGFGPGLIVEAALLV